MLYNVISYLHIICIKFFCSVLINFLIKWGNRLFLLTSDGHWSVSPQIRLVFQRLYLPYVNLSERELNARCKIFQAGMHVLQSYLFLPRGSVSTIIFAFIRHLCRAFSPATKNSRRKLTTTRIRLRLTLNTLAEAHKKYHICFKKRRSNKDRSYFIDTNK